MTAALNIEYFEKGCLCVLAGLIPKAPLSNYSEMSQYYLDACTCSRHPESTNREPWDADKVLRAQAVEKIQNMVSL